MTGSCVFSGLTYPSNCMSVSFPCKHRNSSVLFEHWIRRGCVLCSPLSCDSSVKQEVFDNLLVAFLVRGYRYFIGIISREIPNVNNMNRDQLMQLPDLKDFKGKEDIVKVCSIELCMAVLARGSFHLSLSGKWYEFEPHNLEDFVTNGDDVAAIDHGGLLLSAWNMRKNISDKYCGRFEFFKIFEGMRIVKMAMGEERFFAMAQDGGLFGCTWKFGSYPTIRIHYELDWHLYDICDTEPANQKVNQLLCTFEYPILLSSCGKVFIPEDEPEDNNIGHLTQKKVQIFGETLNGKKVIEFAVGIFHSFVLTNSGDLYLWSYGHDEFLEMIDYKCHAHQSRGKRIWTSFSQDLVLVLLESGSLVCIKFNELDGEVITKSIFSSTLAVHCFVAFYVEGWLYNGVQKLRNTGIKDMWMRKLEAIFDEEDASDIIIEAEGKPIHCHKSFVAAHCEYIKNWIKNEEEKENAGEKLRLCSKDLKYETLHTILNYFYTGSLEFHSFDITLNLIEVTEMWVEKKMQKHFVDQAIQHLSFENALLAKKIADKLEIEVLKEACISHNPDLMYVKS